MEKFKRAKEWVIGRKYYVVCGIWRGFTTYVGTVREGNRIKHEFLFGNPNEYDKQFSIVSAKSNLKVYECSANL